MFQSRNRETSDFNNANVVVSGVIFSGFQSRNRETFDSNWAHLGTSLKLSVVSIS